jgi:tetratricopeptide (TPR) repeat protein
MALAWSPPFNNPRRRRRLHPETAMRRFAVIFLVVLTGLAWLPGAVQAGQALLVKAMEAQKAGHNAEALKLLNLYVERFPQMKGARYYRALALDGLGRKKEALEDVDQALEDNPCCVKYLMLKGKILASMDRRPEAILIFSRVIKEDPREVEAYKERGEALSQEGRFDQALADLNRAARLAPRDPWVFNKRGLVWFCKGDYRQAVHDFTTAIKLRPDLAISYFFRGNIYRHHLHQREQAIADFQRGCCLGSTLCCRELEKMGVKPEK